MFPGGFYLLRQLTEGLAESASIVTPQKSAKQNNFVHGIRHCCPRKSSYNGDSDLKT